MLNLPRHMTTPQQAAAGVVELSDKGAVQQLSAVDEPPTAAMIQQRARALAELAVQHGADTTMISGAPHLTKPLERELAVRGIRALSASSGVLSLYPTHQKRGARGLINE